MCWRIDNGSALSVQQCALSTAVWGMHCGLGASSQANRLRASCLQRRRGRGGRPEDSGSAAALSSLFALQWFSHQTRLLNQRPPLTKAANYASMRCPPPPCRFRVPIRVSSFSALFYVASTVSLWLIFPGLGQMGKHSDASLTFSWSLCNSLSAPLKDEERRPVKVFCLPMVTVIVAEV